MNRKLVLVMGIVLLAVSMVSESGMIHVMSGAEPGVNVFVDPGSVNVAPNDVFNLTVNVANAKDVARWMLSLRWNASVIELFPASSEALTEGSFMSKFGTTVFHRPLYQGSGVVSSISCDFKPPSRANGDGILLSVSFRAIGHGETDITVYDCVLTSSSTVRTISTCNKGRVSVGPLPHYVKVSLDPIGEVFANEKTLLIASVTNLGTVDELNFNMRIRINGAVVNSSHLDLLKTGSSYQLSYEWTPVILGLYTVISEVDSLPNGTIVENGTAVVLVTVKSKTHAIAVSLNCPPQAYVNQTVLLNLTVTNQGAFDETNVSLTMTVYGANESVNIAFPMISMLRIGSNSSFNYPWKFSHVGNYDINVTVNQAANESLNRTARATVAVVEQGKPTKADILIVSDTSGIYHSHGTSLEEFKSALAGINYDVWFENYLSVNGSVLTADVLQAYKLVIWTCGDYMKYVIDPDEEQLLLGYNQRGGNVLLEGETVLVSLVALNCYDLIQNMLYVKYEESRLSTTGIEPATSGLEHQHMIVQGLDLGTTWANAPSWGPDGVEPIDKGFAVMRYSGTGHAAVTVVDGSETGKGSVVYYSFSLFSLPDAYRNRLVKNTVAWFKRCGISVVTGQVLYASPGSVSFIYGGSTQETDSESSIVAGSMLYAICKNEQVQLFADDVNASSLNDSLVCLFGGFTNKILQEYNTSGMMPITMCQIDGDPNHYVLIENSSKPVYEFHLDPGRNSTFIIQVFTDSERNTTCLAVWSADSKGIWATGICLSRIVARQLRDYSGKYCVFNWVDTNGDSVPQQEEIKEVLYAPN